MYFRGYLVFVEICNFSNALFQLPIVWNTTSFQIRRCDNVDCCQPGTKWSWLPDPVIDNTGNHYQPFETVFGTDTSEKDRPSSQNQTLAAVAQEQQVLFTF